MPFAAKQFLRTCYVFSGFSSELEFEIMRIKEIYYTLW